MSSVNITGIQVLNNEAPWNTPFQFEVSFEALVTLKEGFCSPAYFHFSLLVLSQWIELKPLYSMFFAPTFLNNRS